MDFAKPAYSLRYDERGCEKETNLISPLLTAPDFSIEEVNENIRDQYQTARDAIETARRNRFDIDLFVEYGVIEVVVYRKSSECMNLTSMMPLFGRANLFSISDHKPSSSVMLTATYLFTADKCRA